MTYNTKTGKENNKDMDYNSSRRFRHEVQESSVALSIKCDSWPYELRKPFTTDRFFPIKILIFRMLLMQPLYSLTLGY